MGRGRNQVKTSYFNQIFSLTDFFFNEYLSGISWFTNTAWFALAKMLTFLDFKTYLNLDVPIQMSRNNVLHLRRVFV